MCRRVAAVRNYISEIIIASITRVGKISALRKTLKVTSNWSTLRRNTNCLRKEAMNGIQERWVELSTYWNVHCISLLSSTQLSCIPFIASFLKQLVFLCSVLQLLVTANIFPTSLILATLMMEVLLLSETSILTRAIRSYIPEDGILRSHRREILTYIALTAWVM
jgi:hypothetical protein